MTRRTRRSGAALVIVLAASACADVRDATTDPASPQAAEINGLFWFSLLLGVAVWIVVTGLLAVPLVRSLRRRRRGGDPHAADGRASDTEPGLDLPAAETDEPLVTADRHLADESASDHRARSRLVWLGGIVVPAIILVTLLVYSSNVGRSVAHVPEDGELVVEVVGHMFWWEVRYPDLDITTANEIVVPVDQPVRLELTTEDVIHSFWIPRLHGKVDMIPGTTNDLTFTAEQEGRFRGNCAEFCGIAHAQMVAFVEARTPSDFDAWVEGQQAPPATPDPGSSVAEGERVFLEVGCAACHTVDGVSTGAVGPDLTHLASRGSLAAGIVPNTREHLAELLVDPWGLKPGNPMPPTELEDAELEALLDYLQDLS